MCFNIANHSFDILFRVFLQYFISPGCEGILWVHTSEIFFDLGSRCMIYYRLESPDDHGLVSDLSGKRRSDCNERDCSRSQQTNLASMFLLPVGTRKGLTVVKYQTRKAEALSGLPPPPPYRGRKKGHSQGPDSGERKSKTLPSLAGGDNFIGRGLADLLSGARRPRQE